MVPFILQLLVDVQLDDAGNASRFLRIIIVRREHRCRFILVEISSEVRPLGKLIVLQRVLLGRLALIRQHDVELPMKSSLS